MDEPPPASSAHAAAASAPTPRLGRRTLARRAGLCVFVFFLLKGLAWLLIPGSLALVAWLGE